MPVTRIIAVNNNAGAYTPIAASIAARSMQMIEDGSATAQGLQVQFPVDGFAVTSNVPYGQQPLSVVGAGKDGLAGLPAQNSGSPTAFNHRAADIYCQVRSATATPTTVRVVETETT